MTTAEVQAIKPFLERIYTSEIARLDRLWDYFQFFCRRVQLLKERENFGFEYSGAEDPSRMVPALELTDEEVLEHL